MVELPAPMATLPAPKATVEVGPPLFCRGSRLSWALVTVVAQEKVPWVTRLFALVEGLTRLTLTLPEKSPPPVLFARMVLEMLREPPLPRMPPPETAELRAIVVLVMFRAVLLKMPPPLALVAVLPKMVELKMESVPILTKPPPALAAVFPEIVELVMVMVPLLLIPPAWLAEMLPEIVVLEIVRTAEESFWIPPP